MRQQNLISFLRPWNILCWQFISAIRNFVFAFQVLNHFIHSHDICYENYNTGEYFNA